MVGTAVPDDLATGWWGALAAGLVVALVLVLLLHVLLRTVKGVERELAEVWESGKALARNTATTWLLTETARLVHDLHREALEHDELLSRKGG